MPLGTEEGLGPGDIVLDGTQLPHAQQPPLFGPRLLWPNGLPSQLLLSSCMHLVPEGCSNRALSRAVCTGVSVKVVIDFSEFDYNEHAPIRANTRLSALSVECGCPLILNRGTDPEAQRADFVK